MVPQKGYLLTNYGPLNGNNILLQIGLINDTNFTNESIDDIISQIVAQSVCFIKLVE